jgi:hypothetical protein
MTNTYYPNTLKELQSYFSGGTNLKGGDIVQLGYNIIYNGYLTINDIHGEDNKYIYLLGDNTTTIDSGDTSKGISLNIINSSYIYILV